MNIFLLTLESIGALLLCVLSLAIVTYLSTIREKDAATLWLIATVGSLSAVFSLRFVVSSLNPDVFNSLLWKEVVTGLSWLDLSWVLFMLLLLVFSLSFLQFAYAFLHDSFRNERRLALLTGGIASVVLICWIAWLRHQYRVTSGVEGTLSGPYFAHLCILIFGWAVVVLVRKERRVGETAERSEVMATRAYVVLALLALAYFTGMALQGKTLGQTLVSWGPGLLGIVGFCCGLVIVYLNHAPQPTTLQVKLIGLTLVTVIGLLAVTGLTLFSDPVRPLPRLQTVKFEPDSLLEGGYRVRNLPYSFGETAGEALTMQDDSDVGLALPWSFPFGEQAWDSLYVYSNGFVSFGGRLGKNSMAQWSRLSDSHPKITPLFIDVNPVDGGQVDVLRDVESTTITWRDIPFYAAREDRYSFQLTLFRDGAIMFSYGDNPPYSGSFVESTYLMRGIFPGGGAATDTMQWSGRLPMSLPPRETLSENFRQRVRMDIHETVAPFAWIILGGSLFVLVIFPSFFRSSLVKPLWSLQVGVQQVEEGKLDTHVPVGVHDEIGYLTHQFNQMTKSLRTYAEKMDELVAQRTGELELSLTQLRKTQAQLIQQEKMASLGQLTAGMAHEIKNPLNFVNNFAEVNSELADELRAALAKGEPVDELLDDLKQNAAVIAQHGKRADGIVQAMMEHASGSTGQREATDINHLVSEHIDRVFHGKQLQMPDFEVETERDLSFPGEVELVPQDIGRVLLNLLDNAFHAVFEQASISKDGYIPTVKVSTQKVDNQVEIRVSDNGPGIPQRIQDRIFEPFYTTKPTGTGTGLGLSLSYDIVTHGHGGSLTVHSEEGQGATFIITLPLDKMDSSLRA